MVIEIKQVEGLLRHLVHVPYERVDDPLVDHNPNHHKKVSHSIVRLDQLLILLPKPAMALNSSIQGCRRGNNVGHNFHHRSIVYYH